MAWKHDVDKRVESFLGGDIKLSPIGAQQLIDAAVKHFGLRPIALEVKNKHTKSLYARANHSLRTGYTIELFPSGLNALSVLHEIAHCFPQSFDHYVHWTWNFFELAKWFRANYWELTKSERLIEEAL